jgi:hypothetical protein
MQKLLFLFLFVIVTCPAVLSQKRMNNNTIKEQIANLRGRIISVTDKKPLQSANIVNLNSVVGTTTNRKGEFQISATTNDTIYISYVGFQSIKLKITKDLLKGNELEIAIHEKTVNIDEVTIKVHNLIGVLEIDAKNVPEDRFTRIHINGLPQAYEVGRPQTKDYTSLAGALFNPLDFWYNKFGKKPKELKKLKKLKQEDNLRSIMEEKFSREILMDYMDMSRKELNDLLKECNYSDNFVRKASDLQVIEAVLDCYENYRAIKKGKVTRDKIRIKNNDKN